MLFNNFPKKITELSLGTLWILLSQQRNQLNWDEILCCVSISQPQKPEIPDPMYKYVYWAQNKLGLKGFQYLAKASIPSLQKLALCN